MVKEIKIKFHKPTTNKHFLWDEVEYFLHMKSLSKKYIDMIMNDDYNYQIFDWLDIKNITDYTYNIDLDNIIFVFGDDHDAEIFARQWIYDHMYFLYRMGLLDTMGLLFCERIYISEHYTTKVIAIHKRDTDDILFYHGMVDSKI